MRKYCFLLLPAIALTCSLALSPAPVQAQKQYLDAFSARYPILGPQIAAQKCRVCHGRLKTNRSDYAEDLKAALGAKNVKGQGAIDAALQQVELREHQPGQTYKDLFDAGMLPPPYVPPEDN